MNLDAREAKHKKPRVIKTQKYPAQNKSHDDCSPALHIFLTPIYAYKPIASISYLGRPLTLTSKYYISIVHEQKKNQSKVTSKDCPSSILFYHFLSLLSVELAFVVVTVVNTNLASS